MKSFMNNPGDLISMLRASEEVHQLNLAWLIRLRWVAIIGQTLVILVAQMLLGVEFEYGILYAIIGLEMFTNIGLKVWLRSLATGREGLVGLVLVADVLFLTSLLYWTGGSFNPFSLLYFIHIALAALVLATSWTWLIAVLSVICYGALFFEFSSLDVEWIYRGGITDLEIQGRWAAFAVTAGVIAFFINKIQRALIRRDNEIVQIRDAQMRSEKLASLATLAAGAAHEFSTPLSTIAVVSSELQRELEQQDVGTNFVEDAKLIREQVERCREILQQMSADAGEFMGEVSQPVEAAELMKQILAGVPRADRVKTSINTATRAHITVPTTALAQALRGIVNNALDATPAGECVELRTTCDADAFVIQVRDQGTGMLPEVRRRVGEPFFTTKPPGQGMGLGVFLARTLVEKIGGTLAVDSEFELGTTVTVRIPSSPDAQDNELRVEE